MPPLCLCAASVPLHETLVSDMELCSQIQNYHHHHHHHHHHHNGRKCTKVIVEVASVGDNAPPIFDLLGQVRVLCESVLGTQHTKERRSSASVPALRPDLAEIPRVGFPPNQPRFCNSGALSKHIRSSRRATMPSSSSNLASEQDVVEKFATICTAQGSNSLIFCRIEAIYI